jgi:release factor glutamine methyltransferase
MLDRLAPPLWRWYVRKERRSSWKNIVVKVPPGVFHPGIFLSTHFLLEHLERYVWRGKAVLEIGAGSGMIAIWCAQQGAEVTATDISLQAVAAIKKNAASNHVSMHVFHSDLYAALPDHRFDAILVNPPYYPNDPKTESEYAWFCGAEFEYFQRFFGGLKRFLKPEGFALMVLSEDCKLDAVQRIAAEKGCKMELIDSRQKVGEWNYIFRIMDN